MNVVLILCSLIASFSVFVKASNNAINMISRAERENNPSPSNDANHEEINVENSKNVTKLARAIPLTLKKNLWLTPNKRILVSEHTAVYNAEREQNGEVLFHEVPRFCFLGKCVAETEFM